MSDASLEHAQLDRASRVVIAARIIGLTCLCATLLAVLFWPILGERSSSRVTNKFGAACGGHGRAHAPAAGQPRRLYAGLASRASGMWAGAPEHALRR
jgi:hypothetical protein